MRKIPLYIPFLLALFPALFCSTFFPSLRLHFFIPFFAIAYYAAPLSKALWISVGCGLILDLLSSEFRFGLQSITCVLTTLLFYSQKKHFFEDKPIAFCLYTSLLACGFTLLQIVMVHLFDRGIPLSVRTFFVDAPLMSALDGLYAFFWFICPLKLYTHIKKVGWRTLFKRNHDEHV